MSKLPITRIRGLAPQAEDDKVEVIETREGAQQGFGAFCTFRYSYTEISAFGGKTRAAGAIGPVGATPFLDRGDECGDS